MSTAQKAQDKLDTEKTNTRVRDKVGVNEDEGPSREESWLSTAIGKEDVRAKYLAAQKENYQKKLKR